MNYVATVESIKMGVEFLRFEATDNDDAYNKVQEWSKDKYGEDYSFAICNEDEVMEI